MKERATLETLEITVDCSVFERQSCLFDLLSNFCCL
eukprot:14773.XXX_613487_613594_1 [CDS] Oithona nana genome sequencing.